MVDEKSNQALEAERRYRTAVEEANDFIENFDLLETITNVGNDEVFTPRKTADMMLDSLPEEVWHNPNYRWLNPATKNGVFEREIAIRLDAGLAKLIPNIETRRKHIFQNMIFSIGQTKFTANVARRTLYYCCQANRKCDGIKAPDGHYVNGYAIGNGTWFSDCEGNIRTPVTEHEIDPKTKKCRYCGMAHDSKYLDANQREKYSYDFIHIDHTHLERELQKWFFGGSKNMKFDIIIGNPPYQLNDGGQKASATPIYNLFVQQAISLNPRYLSMIIPSRWFSGGRGLDDFREMMLEDRHIKSLSDFVDSTDCFPGVDIAGGVCFFLRDREYLGDCEVTTVRNGVTTHNKRDLRQFDCFIRDAESVGIIHKVQLLSKTFFSSVVSSQKPFGLRTYVKALDSGDITLRYNGGSGPFASSEVTTNKNWISKWKVIMSYLTNDHAGRANKDGRRKIFSSLEILPAGYVCTETYIVVGVFDTKVEAENCYNYMKTKFVRFLVAQLTTTQHISKSSFAFVPVLDFSKKWSDEELFSLFGLSSEEISIIDSTIMEMK